MPARPFDSLVEDADRIPLITPDTLRRVGNRRARRRATVVTAAVVLAVIGGSVAALTWLPSTTQQPPDVGATTDRSPAPCSATDLQYSGQTDGLGMGSAGKRYTLVMVGGSACRLDETPVLAHLNGSTWDTIPLAPDGTPTEVVVGPGDRVEFTVLTVDGYGGYATDAPECAHPRSYQQLGVVMPDGGTVPLAGAADLSIDCVDGDGQLGSITNWATA